MVSGIVYFDEIVENIKDATGIENMRPLYSRIRRWCYNCEVDIGAGGVVVLKKKQYEVGDGFYDGKTLKLPADFVSEWSYAGLTNGIVQGNVFKLYHEGGSQIDFRYLGFLLDEEGNPFTTRNRLNAIVAYAVYRLYSSKYFLGTGNRNQYAGYQMEYEDAIGAARGNDAFPSEEDWNALGAIRLGGTFEAMTDCGMKMICLGSEDPSTLNTTLPDPIPSCISPMEGISNGSATMFGDLLYYSKLFLEGIINGATEVIANLQKGTLPDFAIIGASNALATVTGELFESEPIVACNSSFDHSGSAGTFRFRLELGSAIGFGGIDVLSFSVPDRFRIYFNGVEVANSKFIGHSNYEQDLLNLGYTLNEMSLTNPAPSTYTPITFYKGSTSPSFAVVYVDAPLGGTAWRVKGICPETGTQGYATVSGTLTIRFEPLGGVATTSGTLTEA